jgi:hypothetical protein
MGRAGVRARVGVRVGVRVLGLALAEGRLDDARHVVVGRGATRLHIDKRALHLVWVRVRASASARVRAKVRAGVRVRVRV